MTDNRKPVDPGAVAEWLVKVQAATYYPLRPQPGPDATDDQPDETTPTYNGKPSPPLPSHSTGPTPVFYNGKLVEPPTPNLID